MADRPPDKPTVENRWWAEIGRKREPPATKKEGTHVDRLFKIVDGYDQDQARDNLTDHNLRLLHQANPVEGEWTVLHLLESKYPVQRLERLKRAVDLPRYARGTIIDCGRTVRLLVTGTPVGERVLELALLEVPSFDCWVKGEWVREELYKNTDEALARFRRHIRNYLSPEGIALAESISAQV